MSADIRTPTPDPASPSASPLNLHTPNTSAHKFGFAALLGAGVIYTAVNLFVDLNTSVAVTAWPFVLLAVALLIALGFEFVNGFHDTANAVATVIYTRSLKPHVAVVLSGVFNFLGVLFSSGAVAFGIIALLPMELMLQVGSGTGLAMVFALLIAAIVWNLGTWWLGLPVSSSHTLIGSILGVGIAHAILQGQSGTSGVDWWDASKVAQSMVFSTLCGFLCAALLWWSLRKLVQNPVLFAQPQGAQPPPWWIRGLLILTCTGVSFAHGSNDGQKGMGLIMLMLIGTVPTSYALNRAMPSSQVLEVVALAEVTEHALLRLSSRPAPMEPRDELKRFARTHLTTPDTVPALAALIAQIRVQLQAFDSIQRMPSTRVPNVRNDVYLTSEVMRLLRSDPHVTLDDEARSHLHALQRQMDAAIKYIPLWVKVAVAIALGLGTLIGWRRIVITVGEKIGKSHLTYAQGAAAEWVTMGTIAAADVYGLPVSTTHVLSSGVAGAMVASGAGLHMSTLSRLLGAWLLTLPMAIVLSGGLYLLICTML